MFGMDATWSLDGLRVRLHSDFTRKNPQIIHIGPRFIRATNGASDPLWHHSWSSLGGVAHDLTEICLLDRRKRFVRSIPVGAHGDSDVTVVVEEIAKHIDRVRLHTSVHDDLDPRLLFIREEAQRRDRG